MTRSGAVTLVLGSAIVAGGGGWLLGETVGLVVGLLLGVAFGVGALAAGMRPLVGVSLVAGATGGAIIGEGIAAALCSPGSCTGVATAAAFVTAIGALVGVGLVVALVTRSFDEYREAVEANRPPPTPGCETGDATEDIVDSSGDERG